MCTCRLSQIICFRLTTVGALDEIVYLPALLLAKLFDYMELALGGLLASILILVVVSLALAQCKPLLDWLDGACSGPGIREGHLRLPGALVHAVNPFYPPFSRYTALRGCQRVCADYNHPARVGVGGVGSVVS